MDRRSRMESRSAWKLIFLCILFSGILIGYTSIRLSIFPQVGHILMDVCILLVMVTLVIFLLHHSILRGPHYALVHQSLCRSVCRTMLKNKIYVKYSLVWPQIPVLQNFKLSLSDDLSVGTLQIRREPSLDDKLDKIDLSSALFDYVVEDRAIDQDGNWIYFYLIDAKEDVRLVFDSFQEFIKYYKRLPRGLFFKIDERTTIPLTHSLITGITGKGKTYLLKTLLAVTWTWTMHPIFYFADGKLSGLRKLGRAVGVSVETDIDAISRMLSTVCDRMMYRYKERDRRDELGEDGDAWLDLQPPLIMVIDEAASYLSRVAALSAAERKVPLTRLSDIVRLGREAKCYVWLIMQTAKADVIPTDIRSNFGFRCVLGPDSDTGYQTVFGSKEDIPDHVLLPDGAGYYTCDGQTIHPMPMRSPTLNFDLIAELKAAGIQFTDGAKAAGSAGGL